MVDKILGEKIRHARVHLFSFPSSSLCPPSLTLHPILSHHIKPSLPLPLSPLLSPPPQPFPFQTPKPPSPPKSSINSHPQPSPYQGGHTHVTHGPLLVQHGLWIFRGTQEPGTENRETRLWHGGPALVTSLPGTETRETRFLRRTSALVNGFLQ